MHIEPGLIDGAKMTLAWATAAGAAGYVGKLALAEIARGRLGSLAVRSALATAATFIAFEVLPHFPVGVSEVHFIFGTTLLLILGAAPAAIGLAAGLLVQGLFFVPTDLPMYFVNVTTLLVPLLGIAALARRIVPPETAYVDLGYGHVLRLSASFQGGVVAWVAFWAFYGQGMSVESLQAVLSFGAAYMLVVVIEPLADLAILAVAKALRDRTPASLVTPRLFNAA